VSTRTLLLIPIGLLMIAAMLVAGPYGALIDDVGSAHLVEQHPFADARDAASSLAGLGEEQRRLYRSHLLWDGLMVAGNATVVFALLGVGLARLGLERRASAIALLLACGPVLCEVGENLGIWVLLSQGVEPSAAAASLPVGFVSGKLILLRVAVAATAAVWAAVVVRVLWRRVHAEGTVESVPAAN